MATLGNMIDEVTSRLSGFGLRSEAETYLKAGISATDFAATVNSVESIGKGVVEIDDELIQVTGVDRTINSIQIPPYGRGIEGSTAATHATGAKVTINPKFSRNMIKTAINDTIRSVFPRISGVGSYEFNATPAVNTYALPSAVEGVVGVSYQTIGATKEWLPVRGYRIDPMASPSEFGSKNTITLLSATAPNQPVRVTYTYEPDVLDSSGDDFSSTTGLPESAKDVIVLGACHNLLSFIEAGLLSYSSPEAQNQAGKMGAGAASNVAKYIYALYQKRLEDEAMKQRSRFPIRVTYTN